MIIFNDPDEAVVNGYCKLVETVAVSALKPGVFSPPEANLKFADSILLQHYCDVFNVDHKTFRDAIIRINKEYKPKPKPENNKFNETWVKGYKEKLDGKATMDNRAEKTE